MPLTYTGRLVDPDGNTPPALLDIAVSLSRLPRFAGHAGSNWSVLDHTLYCDDLAATSINGDEPSLRVAVLLHDAHESITGDIPTPVKTPDMKALQDALDDLIFGAYHPTGFRWPKTVGAVDRQALAAEAHRLLPHYYDTIREHFGPFDSSADDMLKAYLGQPYARMGSSCQYEFKPYLSPPVLEYLRRLKRYGVVDKPGIIYYLEMPTDLRPLVGTQVQLRSLEGSPSTPCF